MLSIVQIGKKPKAGTYLWKFTGDDSAFIGSKCLYDAQGPQESAAASATAFEWPGRSADIDMETEKR